MLLVTLAACGGGSSDQQSTQNRDNSDTTQPTGISPDDPGCRYIVAGEGSRATNPGGAAQWLSTAIAQPYACYDKVSFTFVADSQLPLPTVSEDSEDTESTEEELTVTCAPAYTVEYRKAPFDLLRPDPAKPPDQWKAVPTTTAGFKEAKAVIYVEMAPATAVSEFPRRPELAYPGNQRLSFQGMHHVNIVEWVKGLPEGEQTTVTTTTVPGAPVVHPRVVWLIGLDEKRPFTVDCAPGPVPDGPPCPEDTDCAHISVLIMR
jgi:hypothetical protein